MGRSTIWPITSRPTLADPARTNRPLGRRRATVPDKSILLLRARASKIRPTATPQAWDAIQKRQIAPMTNSRKPTNHAAAATRAAPDATNKPSIARRFAGRATRLMRVVADSTAAYKIKASELTGTRRICVQRLLVTAPQPDSSPQPGRLSLVSEPQRKADRAKAIADKPGRRQGPDRATSEAGPSCLLGPSQAHDYRSAPRFEQAQKHMIINRSTESQGPSSGFTA